MISPERLIGLIDLTSLNADDNDEIIKSLCQKAQTPLGPVAAVCVLPAFVSLAHQLLKNTGIKVATVANFPFGDHTLVGSLEEINAALKAGADEIDVVLPAFLIKAKQLSAARDFVLQCRHAAGKACLKIIIETGLLNPQEIADATIVTMDGGADFVKTSTGKQSVGATPEAVQLILHVLKKYPERRLGLKISGGIRTLADAQVYLTMVQHAMGAEWLQSSCFRFGASQLLDQLVSRS
jgi:deoxyribose-phosphate aldolase